MADLLNQKEDVLKFEFTSYGRSKLALGNFMPAYYYFFEDRKSTRLNSSHRT